jgi:Carboxypeptidase regulatory-like domain
MRSIQKLLCSLTAVLSLLLLTFTLLPIAHAQETTAAVQGVITDPTGAIVTGATVVATSSSLINSAKATSDSHGYYRLNALPPGTYTLTVIGQGMSAKATSLVLAAGDLPNLNIKLTVGAESVIDVSASVAMVDVTQSKVETTISNETLQLIPKGRSFQSVIAFAPGARQEPLQSIAPNAAGASVSPLLSGARNNGYQIDGASDAENIYLLDGVNITGITGGGSGTGAGGNAGFNVPNEFVQEVQVKSSSFEAEFGGAMGGVVNVVSQRGTNDWHGSFFTYYRSSALNANDQCGFNYTAQCGLRLDPTTSANSNTRTDGAAQFYIAQQDHYKIIEPGFWVGGPLVRDKLRLFASYVPQMYRARRTVNFTGVNPGPRDFNTSQDAHYGFARLDYAPISKLNLFAGWENAYTRLTGSSLPNPDSKIGQKNSSATTDPTTFRQDTGSVNPASVYIFGADYTINSHTLISARYGYTYANSEDRGKPIGTRYLYSTNAVADSTKGPGSETLVPDPLRPGHGITFSGAGVPSSFFAPSGTANIASNSQGIYNVLSRKQLNIDGSYLKSGLYGTHNFKGGYALTNTMNSLLSGYKTSEVDLYYAADYTVATAATACDAIIAGNVIKYGSTANGHCRGNYGYFTVHDGVDNTGVAKGNNSAFYIQDDWQVGRTGLTLNLGVRFDKEYLPPYSAGASSIGFGFGQKIAPRIGGAYDLLHNGKVKIYASYGKFYDIIKYSLPSGSFGGQYWHDCTYAWDDYNYNTITPTAPNNHGCPSSGAAPGVGVGTFIENVDFRKNVINTQDPGVDPNIKPMSQHEFVAGSDWAVTPTMSFTARYARKRLDNTIEDIGASDNLGFYIGNPGPGYGDTLHRTLYGSGLTAPLCASCPLQPKANRNYDGIELKVTKTVGNKWFVSAFYTYSKLTGNYPGLTSTNISDGSGGRASPNNNRSFDEPQMQFTAQGKPFGGPLPTDRPNTFQAFGDYQQKWFGGNSTLGISQSIFQGTPLTTAWPTLGSTSSVQFVENQGNWVNLHRDAASGDVVVDSITHGRRTPAYIQTNANLTHYVGISKDHERRKLGAEVNFYNLFNQHAVTSVYDLPLTAGTFPSDPTNPTGYDYKSLTSGWNYVGVSNSPGQLKTVSSRYNQPALFQAARQIQLKLAYTF